MFLIKLLFCNYYQVVMIEKLINESVFLLRGEQIVSKK